MEMRLVVFVLLVLGLASASPLAQPAAIQSPYVGSDAPSFWEDIKTVHQLSRRSHMHGGSRPFFETITNALSDAEKSAFDRLSQGMLPDSMGFESTSEGTQNFPMYLKDCDTTEEPKMSVSLMHLNKIRATIDPQHIKLKLNISAEIDVPLTSDMQHHTVVTVADSPFSAQMAPFVLYDKSGSICDKFGSVLGCPLEAGHLDTAKKVKVPGLDAVMSLPRRLYDARMRITDKDLLVSCFHVLLDLRPPMEQHRNPVTSAATLIEPFQQEQKHDALAVNSSLVNGTVPVGNASVIPVVATETMVNSSVNNTTITPSVNATVKPVRVEIPQQQVLKKLPSEKIEQQLNIQSLAQLASVIDQAQTEQEHQQEQHQAEEQAKAMLDQEMKQVEQPQEQPSMLMSYMQPYLPTQAVSMGTNMMNAMELVRANMPGLPTPLANVRSYLGW